MLKNSLKYFSLLLLLFTIGCAKRGNITGGDKDTIAPVLTSSFALRPSKSYSATKWLGDAELSSLPLAITRIMADGPLAMSDEVSGRTRGWRPWPGTWGRDGWST